MSFRDAPASASAGDGKLHLAFLWVLKISLMLPKQTVTTEPDFQSQVDELNLRILSEWIFKNIQLKKFQLHVLDKGK